MTTESRAPDTAAETPIRAQMIIGGEAVDAADGQTFELVNPATGPGIGTAPLGGKEDVDRAVEAATKAFEDRKGWANWAAGKRGRTLAKYAALVKQNSEELAQTETRNIGKAIANSRGEAVGVSLVLDYYAGAANKVFGETIPVGRPGIELTLREPIGVIGAIVPWNFPMYMASWKLGPALAAGNTVVLKPASASPLTAIRLGELALEAGIPPGVLNVVTGPGGTVGASIAAHDGIGKVAFTGETITGQEIMRLAASNVKKISLELGGKSPNVVFADADLEKFAREAAPAVFGNCGQDCTARSRIIVERSVHDRVVELLTAATEALVVGDPTDDATQVGSLVSTKQRERVAEYVESARAEGATVITGGRAPDDGALADGRLLPADDPRRRRTRDARRARGDLRAGRVGPRLRHRGRGDPAGQRDAVRPVGLGLEPRHRAGPADREGHPLRDAQHQLERGRSRRGAVRRLQAVRDRPRARDARARPLHGDEEHLHRPGLSRAAARRRPVRTSRASFRAR